MDVENLIAEVAILMSEMERKGYQRAVAVAVAVARKCLALCRRYRYAYGTAGDPLGRGDFFATFASSSTASPCIPPSVILATHETCHLAPCGS